MNHLFKALVIIGLLVWASTSMHAQDGPEVPCMLCPANTVAPNPESGIWRNPAPSGTGFILEVQHNTLGGFYYLLDEEGQATWYLISAAMEMEEIPGIMGASERRWVAEAELERQAIEGDPDTPVAYGLRRIDTISEPGADPVPRSRPVIAPPPLPGSA